MSPRPPAACPYCGDTHFESWITSRDTEARTWQWGICHSCGAVYLAPAPDAQQLAAAYSKTYYGETAAKFSGLSARFIEACRRSRARRLARSLQSGATVLDVGCGNGGFLAALGELGPFRLFGTELPGPAAERAAQRPGVRLHTGEFVAGTFPAETFDLVTLFHVFEHLTRPRELLSEIHRRLRPDGRLVLSFPNISSMQARLFGGRWLHLDPPRHLFLFPPQPFAHAMTAAGFEIVATRYFSIEQNPFGFIQSVLNCVLRDRDVLYERLKGNKTYAPQHGTGSVALQKAFAAICLPGAVALDLLESGLGCAATVEYTLRKNSLP